MGMGAVAVGAQAVQRGNSEGAGEVTVGAAAGLQILKIEADFRRR